MKKLRDLWETRRRCDQCSNSEPNDLGSSLGRDQCLVFLCKALLFIFNLGSKRFREREMFLACWSCENWGENKTSSETEDPIQGIVKILLVAYYASCICDTWPGADYLISRKWKCYKYLFVSLILTKCWVWFGISRYRCHVLKFLLCDSHSQFWYHWLKAFGFVFFFFFVLFCFLFLFRFVLFFCICYILLGL